MEYLLSSKNIQILESLSLVHTLFGFDFDGTLAPISKDPSNVSISPVCESYLDKLNKTAPIAIITGRSVEDVINFLPFTPKYVIGNHGIEGSHSQDELEYLKTIIQNYKTLILHQYLDAFSSMGILLEDKTYSLSLHYRNSINPELAEQFLMSNLSYFSEAHVTKGKKVINIVPDNGLTKGQAFMQILSKENAKFGIYIGDDVTDEDVFIYKNPRLLTVKVGFSEDSQAGYYLENQEEVVKILEILCRRRCEF